MFRERTGLKLVHVPYRGAAPAVQDVVGGQVPFMFVDTASGYSFILSGKLRPIGVASPKRVSGFDTIPTLAEQGLKGFEAYAWQGLVVPAATPQDVVDTLNKALTTALDSRRSRRASRHSASRRSPSTPAQMAHVREDRA